jgi:hypothetical protein
MRYLSMVGRYLVNPQHWRSYIEIAGFFSFAVAPWEYILWSPLRSECWTNSCFQLLRLPCASLSCVFEYLFSSSNRANFFVREGNWHLLGFSRVCVRICLVWCSRRAKHLHRTCIWTVAVDLVSRTSWFWLTSLTLVFFFPPACWRHADWNTD